MDTNNTASFDITAFSKFLVSKNNNFALFFVYR